MRVKVFIRERVWRSEFDAVDVPGRLVHLLAFESGGYRN